MRICSNDSFESEISRRPLAPQQQQPPPLGAARMNKGSRQGFSIPLDSSTKQELKYSQVRVVGSFSFLNAAQLGRSSVGIPPRPLPSSKVLVNSEV
jgi:hypothetical protein